MIKAPLPVKDRVRLAEFSLLMGVLGVDPADYYFLSREAHGGFRTDVEAIRSGQAERGAQ
jgi:hypothetical protein